ncbi:MAG TPA: protein translocase SEC61 complex subunit gamma [Candidatus Nanoarchaeia archaeon]|nr:protein translocase SEC61 complex subunit gamma [Candidatus Nanoarchaeia archaeon]
MRTFFIECKRVFKVTKKPSKEEFKITVKVSAIGIGIIGLIGFIVHIVGVLSGL